MAPYDWWTGSLAGQRRIVENALATTLQMLNKSKLSALKVPTPPLTEQRRIVVEVDRRLSIVREEGVELEVSLKRAHALRQSSFPRAFEKQRTQWPTL